MNRGQMQSTETIAVLFIFFILILFAIIFYYNYQKVALTEKQEELLGSRAIDTATRVLFLPEIKCTNRETPEDNCIDLLKMRPLAAVASLTESPSYFENSDNKEYYFQLFSYAKITVKQLYPSDESEWVLYDVEKPNWHKKEPTSFIVRLKDETAGVNGQPKYSFGYLQVEVYS